MKNILIKLKDFFIMIFATFVMLPILGILFIVSMPFRIYKYHKSPYYKHTKKRYKISENDVAKLYDKIENENLPIEYHENAGYEYFVKDKTLIIPYWGYEAFEKINGEWGLYLKKNDIKEFEALEKILEDEAAKVKPEHRNYTKRLLIDKTELDDAEEYEISETCPYLYCPFTDSERKT